MAEVITYAVTFGAIVGFVYFLVWWSYQARADRSAKVGLYLILGIPGFLLLVAGLSFIVRGDISPWGSTLLLTGLGLTAPIARRTRLLFSRLGSFSPDDPVHITGLGIFLGLTGYLGGQNILSRAPDVVAEVDIAGIVVQGVFFVGLALACVGLGVGRNLHQTRVRLGLGPVTLRGLGATLGVVLAGFAIAIAASALQLAVDADTSELIDQNLESITGGYSVLVMAPLIGLTAGIGEELVMRGVLQPRYGIVLSSLLFTALHGQYGLSFVLLGLFCLSILLGLLAKRYGTTHAIIAHTLYNMVSVLLSSL